VVRESRLVRVGEGGVRLRLCAIGRENIVKIDAGPVVTIGERSDVPGRWSGGCIRLATGSCVLRNKIAIEGV
jgi:hypothetical protein